MTNLSMNNSYAKQSSMDIDNEDSMDAPSVGSNDASVTSTPIMRKVLFKLLHLNTNKFLTYLIL